METIENPSLAPCGVCTAVTAPGVTFPVEIDWKNAGCLCREHAADRIAELEGALQRLSPGVDLSEPDSITSDFEKEHGYPEFISYDEHMDVVMGQEYRAVAYYLQEVAWLSGCVHMAYEETVLFAKTNFDRDLDGTREFVYEVLSNLAEDGQLEHMRHKHGLSIPSIPDDLATWLREVQSHDTGHKHSAKPRKFSN